jgi:hypothetical protein
MYNHFVSTLVVVIVFFYLSIANAQDPKDFSVAIADKCLMPDISGLGGDCGLEGAEIQITVKVDAIRINAVKINKGNCRNFSQIPTLAKFGDRIVVTAHCHPILVELETDQGKYDYQGE